MKWSSDRYEGRVISVASDRYDQEITAMRNRSILVLIAIVIALYISPIYAQARIQYIWLYAGKQIYYMTKNQVVAVQNEDNNTKVVHYGYGNVVFTQGTVSRDYTCKASYCAVYVFIFTRNTAITNGTTYMGFGSTIIRDLDGSMISPTINSFASVQAMMIGFIEGDLQAGIWQTILGISIGAFVLASILKIFQEGKVRISTDASSSSIDASDTDGVSAEEAHSEGGSE